MEINLIMYNINQAEQLILQDKLDKEYLAITGLASFTKEAVLLAYGKDSEPLKEGRVSLFFF